MLTIEFYNSKDRAIFIQVDPWACLYKLEKDDRIEFAFDDSSDEPFISIDDYDDDKRIVTLGSESFFIVLNGQKIHWEKYPTNI